MNFKAEAREGLDKDENLEYVKHEPAFLNIFFVINCRSECVQYTYHIIVYVSRVNHDDVLILEFPFPALACSFNLIFREPATISFCTLWRVAEQGLCHCRHFFIMLL